MSRGTLGIIAIVILIALVVYFVVRRNLFVGIATGFAVLTAIVALGRA